MSTITQPNTSNADDVVASISAASAMTHNKPIPSKLEVLTQSIRQRDEATKLLQSLLDAKRVSERNLASIRQDDLVKRVTGSSSMDNAIASTRRLIDSFNRVIDEIRRTLSDEDLALLA